MTSTLRISGLACLMLFGLGVQLCSCAGDPTGGDAIPTGSPCQTGDRCEAGSLCQDGQCRAVCNQSWDCPESNQVCNSGLCYDSGSNTCRSAAECVSPPGPEPACFAAACTNDACSYTAKPAEVCAALSCSDGYIANERVCGTTGTCPNAGGQSCNGYACADATTCRTTCNAVGDCVTGYTCNASHQCVSSTAAALGECCYHPTNCNSVPCGTSLHCGNAQLPAVYVCCAAGDTCCDDHSDCATTGYACNLTTFACRTNCATDDDARCATGYHCFSGDNLCYSSAIGSPCDAPGECASNSCNGVCTSGGGLANGEVCTTGGQCNSGNCSEDYDSTTRYCAPANECANNATSYALNYVLCTAATSLRRCAAAGDWSDAEASPQTTAVQCDAGGGAGTGYDPAATCVDGVGGGFTNLGCQSCQPFRAASATACRTDCATNNDAYCWPGYHCYSGDNLCYDASDGSACDVDGECNIGFCSSDKCSCPYIFAYRNHQWEYVTDDAGNPLGMPVKHALRKGLLSYFGPHYIVLGELDRDSDGLRRVKIRETLHELDYVDELKLVAIDHPVGTEVVASSAHHRIEDRRRYLPEITTIRAPLPLRAARDWLDRDILAAVRERDGIPAPSDPARPQFYTFDFGPLADPHQARLVLDAWSMFGREFVSAQQVRGYLAVPDAAGQFVRVRDIGFPQGDEKRLVIDLNGIFLSADHRVRVHTGTGPGGRARWTIDRAMLDTSPPARAIVREIPALYAALGHKGGLTYQGADYNHRIIAFDDQVGTQTCHLGVGDFTRLGQVTDLVASEDNQFVIMQHGDELVATFADAGDPPAGMVRTWALRSTLFYKQYYRDKNVEPLPFWGMTADPPPPGEHYPDDAVHRRYRTTYNTRRYDPQTLVEVGARAPGASATLVLGVTDQSGLWTPEQLGPLGEVLTRAYRATSADALVSQPGLGAPGAASACDDQPCRVQLGAAAGAQRVLSGVVTGVGHRCAVSITLDDVATHAIERALTVDALCAPDALAQALAEAVEGIAGRVLVGYIPR